MKKICTLLLTAGMLMGVATGASAIDFKAKGQWNVGFGAVDTNWNDDGKMGGKDTFNAGQRVRLQIDAVASEALSGTVYFEIGDISWGKDKVGSISGDAVAVKVKHAYIDWFVPDTMLSFRMGLQPIAVPSAAGGAIVLDDDAAAVMANYKFNDMVSLTMGWIRTHNDNFEGKELRDDSHSSNYQMAEFSNYLDNIDAFIVSLPIQGENYSVNPWFMVGWYGQNAMESFIDGNGNTVAADMGVSMIPAFRGAASAVTQIDHGPGGGTLGFTRPGIDDWNATEEEYTSFWFAGIPITFQHEGWNFELDFNYGSVSYSGMYTSVFAGDDNGDYYRSNMETQWGGNKRSEMTRSGWLLKGLVEYKMDWGTPGLFAWYGSGDNDDVTDGSEMMPFLSPSGNFTSFLGDGEFGWQANSQGYDHMLTYSGTWGIGLQLKDFSFVENLSHILRVAYWGGTNDADMVRYVNSPYGNDSQGGGFYLVEGDYLVEVNFDTKYQIYENLAMHVQLGYIFNGIDADHWNNHRFDGRIKTNDGYKATLSFSYSF